jgi:hypothetical protein
LNNEDDAVMFLLQKIGIQQKYKYAIYFFFSINIRCSLNIRKGWLLDNIPLMQLYNLLQPMPFIKAWSL